MLVYVQFTVFLNRFDTFLQTQVIVLNRLYVFIHFIQITNHANNFLKTMCTKRSNVFTIVNTTNQYLKISEKWFYTNHKHLCTICPNTTNKTLLFVILSNEHGIFSIGPKLITTRLIIHTENAVFLIVYTFITIDLE